MMFGLAVLALLSAAHSTGQPPAFHGRSDIRPEGSKAAPAARFSREGRALSICRSRAARLGEVTAGPVKVPLGGLYTVTGSIRPPSGTSKAQLSFTCAVDKDGLVRSFKVRRIH